MSSLKFRRRVLAPLFVCWGWLVGAGVVAAAAQDAPEPLATLQSVRISSGDEQTAIFLDFDRPVPYLDRLRPATTGSSFEVQVYAAVVAPRAVPRLDPSDERVHRIEITPSGGEGTGVGFVVRIDAAAQVVTRVSSLTSPFRILILVADAPGTIVPAPAATVAVAPSQSVPGAPETATAAPSSTATPAPATEATAPAASAVAAQPKAKKKKKRSKVAAESYDAEALGGDIDDEDLDTGDDSSVAAATAAPRVGAGGKVQLNADNVVQDRQFDEFIAEGSVHAVYGDVAIRADRVVYRAASSELQAEGNVWVTWPAGTLHGASVNVSLDTLTGVVFDGTFSSADGEVRFQGAKIEKTGDDTYHVEDAKLTSCACDPPDWSFTGGDVDITVGGYASGFGTTFRLWDVPAVWAPYLIVPVKTERETGLLIPRFGYSDRRGFQLEQPFFWAIARNVDATFTLETSTEERLGGQVDFRYIRTLTSAGEISGRYFQEQDPRDATTDSEGNPVSGKVERQRYAVEAFHDEILAPGVRGKVLVDVLSDTEVNRDLSDDETLRARRFSQSKVTLTSSWRRWSLLGAVRWYENMVTDSNNELQELPEVTLRGIRQPVPGTPVLLDFRSDATDFYRREGADGLRWDTSPRFFIPIEISHFNLEPSIIPRTTVYYADVALAEESTDPLTGETSTITRLERTTAARLLPQLNVSLDTTLSRVFRGDAKDPNETRWKHEIDPYVTYDWIPEVDQSGLPSFDRADRINQKSLVTYGVEQTLFSRTGGQGNIQQWLDVILEHSFDLLGDTCENGVCPVHGEVAFSPWRALSMSAYTDWDPESHRFADYTLKVGLADSRGDRFTTRYRFVADRIEDVSVGGRLVLWEGTALYGLTRYDQLNSQLLENRGGLHFTAPCDCWGFDLWVIDRTNPEETKVGIQFNFEGLGSAGQAPWWGSRKERRSSLVSSSP